MAMALFLVLFMFWDLEIKEFFLNTEKELLEIMLTQQMLWQLLKKLEK